MNKRLIHLFLFYFLSVHLYAQHNTTYFEDPVPMRAPSPRYKKSIRYAPKDKKEKTVSPTIRPTATSLPQTEILNVQQAVNMALAVNSSLAAQKALMESIRMEGSSASTWRDPQLRLSHDEEEQDSTVPGEASSSSKNNEIALRVYFPDGEDTANHTWRARYQAEKHRLEQLEANIRFDVKKTLLDISYYDRRLELENSLLKLYEDAKNRSRDLNSLGEETKLDGLEHQLNYLRVLEDREETNNELILQAGKLIALTGIKDQNQWHILSAPLESIVNHQYQEDVSLERLALANRPEIKIAEQNINIAQQSLTAERRRYIPWPSFIQVGYEQGEQENQDSSRWSVRTGIDLPIFSMLRPNNTPLAQHIDKAESERMAVVNQVAQEVAGKTYMYLAAEKNWKQLLSTIDPVIQEIETMLHDFDQELAQDASQHREIKAKLIQSKIMKLTSEYTWRLAMLELEYSVGLL